jgi:hypothetical protein
MISTTSARSLQGGWALFYCLSQIATENEPTGKDRKVSSMKKHAAILAFPSVSAVYAMYGGNGRDASRDHS